MNIFTENLFLFCSAYIFLISYYAHYKFILNYHPRVSIENFKVCDNVELMEAQIRGLLKDLDNKYAFWSFQLSFIAVGVLFFLFFPDKSFYLMGFMILIIAIQAGAEYLTFIFPLALRAEVKNMKPSDVLKEKETVKRFERIEAYSKKEHNLKKIQEKISKALKEKSIDTLNENEIMEEFKSANPIPELWKNSHIEKKNNSVLITLNTYSDLTEREYLFDFNKSDLVVDEIKYIDSNYVSSFYERVNFERLFVWGFLEPIAATVVLFIALKM